MDLDFSDAEHTYRRLKGGGRNQLIAKAVGIHKYGLPLTVIDATAGLGQDSFALASLGCKVLMLERVPEIYELLNNGLNKTYQDKAVSTIIKNNMTLSLGDAKDYLQNLSNDDYINYPDIIMLDPMFPTKKKSALPKKRIRLLQTIVGNNPDTDASDLLLLAKNYAKKRVVVKRARYNPCLGDITPDIQMMGKSTRFDVYFC